MSAPDRPDAQLFADEAAPILAAGAWPTNAHLIADVARLGYLRPEWRTLDPTWGYGRFWTVWRPDDLVASDLDPAKSPTGYSVDATATPHDPASFMAVVLDPPYKLNGTSTGKGAASCDESYGVHQPATWQGRHALIEAMIDEAARLTAPGGTLLLKCQAQVVSGAVRWQPRIFANHAESVGWNQIDEFNFPGSRPQPPGRRQVHARRNYSSLLVFTRTKSAQS